MTKEDCAHMIDIDASQYLHKAWRDVKGSRKLIVIDYLDRTWPNGYDTHYKKALHSVEHGIVLGAYEPGRLIGILCVHPMEKWRAFDDALLDQLFISKQYRGQGIGTRLFDEALNRIKEWPIHRLVISAGSTEETVAFYQSLGCREIKDLHQGLYEEDARDIQLEYVIKK